ncbi:hypothetical protein BDF21DRAFT_494086 [Thamnidium elegans]|uniref:PROP1-like PPR domain-containing protein n=1 Tax=Thamnidium elegans TaxID=101142 RepID=A0A8H7T168_9FUNG|nr:hypothetical protein INT48_002550 [Thamnidium elegans]KAI8078333.1 hypothetical protein BDF21DRAFT_494086 [Thamnidium elegans]
MLTSLVAGSCKQSRHCPCYNKTITSLWIEECLFIKPKRRYTTTKRSNVTLISKSAHKNILPRSWISSSWSRSVSTTPTDSTIITKINKRVEYVDILNVALDQSNVSVAQSLLDNTFILLKKGSPELAWDCYRDLTSRHIQKYISRDQYKQLIKHFNHTKSHHTQRLEYLLTLVEDMKQLGYQVGRKEKLLLMRSLGLNGNINAMEQIFEDLKDEQLLFVESPAEGAAQRPFNIMLTSYGEQIDILGPYAVAEKSMKIYGEMLDGNIQPASSTTRLLMENIKMADRSDEMVEKVWEWLWTKIGMNVAGKTKELEPTLYRDMVMYFASAGRPEYALEINDIMTKRKIPRTVRMMTALIHKVGRAGDIDRAMDLLNEMMMVESLVPTLVTFNALIDIHAHKKPVPDIAGANRIYNMLGEVGFLPDTVTFGTLIDMFSKKGDLFGAKKLYNDMKARKITPSPYIFSSFIECFLNLNDHESAMDILSLLKKQAQRGLPPVREAYNLMFKGLVESGLIREAIMLLEVMSKEKMGLEARTFNPLLSYYAKRGEPEGARKVASMMTQAQVKPSSHTYTSLLHSYAKAGDTEGAENIFNILKQKYRPTSHAYNALLYVYTKNNVMDKVLDIYKRMSKAFIRPNEYTYGILMYFYSRRKEIESVESLMKTMESNNIVPGAICWTILMQTYFECDRPEDGRNVMDRMIQAGWEPSNVSWGIMINGLVRANEVELAESVLTEIVDRLQRSYYDTYKHRLLKDANTHVDYDKVLPETIEDVLNKSHASILKPKTRLSSYLFAPIIDAHRKAGNLDQAKSVYKTMVELSVPVTVPIYVSLMTIFNKELNHDAVESMWNVLYKNDTSKLENLDPIFKEPIPVPEMEYSFTNLLTLDGDQDIEVSKPAIRKQVSPFALSIYMNSLISQKRTNEVETLWNKLSSEGYEFDEHNWNRYIVALVESGKLDDACRLISKEFFGKSENNSGNNIKKTHRKRDDIFISNNDQLHTQTCSLLADKLEITGAEFMGDPRLRSVVTDRIKEYVNHLDRLDRSETNT